MTPQTKLNNLTDITAKYQCGFNYGTWRHDATKRAIVLAAVRRERAEQRAEREAEQERHRCVPWPHQEHGYIPMGFPQCTKGTDQ